MKMWLTCEINEIILKRTKEVSKDGFERFFGFRFF